MASSRRVLILAVSFVLIVGALVEPISGQTPELPYESRFVDANGIRLQYMDFGGTGPTLIFVQDLHNFFDDFFGEGEDPLRDQWVTFYASFSNQARVIATVRRGWGESDKPDRGYDVPTQAQDLLALIEALGLEDVVLFGRTAALQDMTWIAEHHPERVAGLIYFGNPFSSEIPTDVRRRIEGPALDDALRHSELYSRASCDLAQEADGLLQPRSTWVPEFLDDPDARITARALRFWSPLARQSMGVRRLEGVERALRTVGPPQPECPSAEAYIAFVDSLWSDPERWQAMRGAFEAADNAIRIDDGIARAFGENMETVSLPDSPGWEATHAFIAPHIRSFLSAVGAADGPAGRSN